MVRSYLDDDEVALIPHDRDAEARANTWCYAVPAGPVDVAEIVTALDFVRDELRRRLAEHAEVVRLAAADPHPGVVAWDEVATVEDSPEITTLHVEQPGDPFPVWVAVV
jgi:hypothetical protein